MAQQVAAAGAGIQLSTAKVDAEILRKAATNILSHSQYKREAEKLGQSFRDVGGHQRGAKEIFAYKQRVGL